MSTRRILSLQYVRKRSGGEVYVEFDDSTKLIVDPDLAVQFHLARGLGLDDSSYDDLVRAQERLAARRRLIRNLTLRKKTAREAEGSLRAHQFHDHAIDYAIQVARDQGYINHEQYAEAYTRAQERSAKKGPRAIRQELQMRGVEKEIVYEAVREASSPDVQRERARDLALKKAPSLRREEPQKARLKLHQFLMRKGYDPEIALEITRETLGREVDE
jgi:regulatory protein